MSLRSTTDRHDLRRMVTQRNEGVCFDAVVGRLARLLALAPIGSVAQPAGDPTMGALSYAQHPLYYTAGKPQQPDTH